MQYPIEPSKLLAAAEQLVPTAAGRGRPAYTANRRGVSTAYYAVFHSIGARVVRQLFPNEPQEIHHRVQRWIGHTDIRVVAQWVAQIDGLRPGSAPKHIEVLFTTGGSRISPGLVAIADGFLQLNEKREQADYDHLAVFTRPDSLQLIALARQLVTSVSEVDTSDASRFFGLIALQARVQHR